METKTSVWTTPNVTYSQQIYGPLGARISPLLLLLYTTSVNVVYNFDKPNDTTLFSPSILLGLPTA